MRKSKYYIILVLLICVPVCIAVAAVLRATLWPSLLFRMVVLHPIPASVKNIRVDTSPGIGRHQYVLRFNVSKADVSLILGSREFKEISYVGYSNGILVYGGGDWFPGRRSIIIYDTWWGQSQPRWFTLGEWKSFKAYLAEKDVPGLYRMRLLAYNEEQGEAYFIEEEARGPGVSLRTQEEWQRRKMEGLTPVASIARAVEFAGGTGKPNDPYKVATAEQLVSIGSDPSLLRSHFVLVNDIDLDPNLPGGRMFTQAVIAPDMGTSGPFPGRAFTGSFNGKGYRISGLTIRVSSGHCLGLFGYIGPGGLVRNLRLEKAAIIGTERSARVGLLAGCISKGTTKNCHVTGRVSCGDSSLLVGGLAGAAHDGTIVKCRASVEVTGGRNSWSLGGLVGYNGPGGELVPMIEPSRGLITECCASGNVSGRDSSRLIGGLIGYNMGNITKCYASGCVSSGEKSEHVGGFVGYHCVGELTNCYALGPVSSGDNSEDVGGLVGFNQGTATCCYAVGGVSGGGGSKSIGGLVGNGGYGIDYSMVEVLRNAGYEIDHSVDDLVGNSSYEFKYSAVSHSF